MIAAAGDLPLGQWQSIPMCNLLFLTVLKLGVVVWILTTALMIWQCRVMRNVHHNNVMFIFQLVPMEQIA
jgi:hypothetical protein